MGFIKQVTFDGLEGFEEYLKPGMFTGLEITAVGTNAPGETADFTDIGQVVLARNDEPKFTRNFSQYAKAQGINGGTPTLDSTAGDVYESVVTIPFMEPGHPNIMNVQSTKEFSLQYIPNPNSRLDNVKLIAYGLTNPAFYQRYQYRMTGADDANSTALQAETVTIPKNNVTALFLDDLDDVIQSFGFNSNGKQVVSTVEPLALRGWTNSINPVEDQTQNVIKVTNNTAGVPGTMRNRKNEIVLNTSGAGAYELTVCSIEPGANFMGR